MMDFVNRLQKDIKKFQSTVQNESEDLIIKLKSMTSKKNIDITKKNVEKIVEEKLKHVEPALVKLITELKENAAKAGIDLGDIDKKIQKAAKNATQKILKKVKSKPVKSKKKASKKKKTTNKSPASKKAATKKTAAKKTTKKKTKAKASNRKKKA